MKIKSLASFKTNPISFSLLLLDKVTKADGVRRIVPLLKHPQIPHF
jgi:hypothetical protein